MAGTLLTVSDSVPNDETHWSYWARVDTKIKGLHSASPFRVPYPCELTPFSLTWPVCICAFNFVTLVNSCHLQIV